jgi:hypothetical protein
MYEKPLPACILAMMRPAQCEVCKLPLPSPSIAKSHYEGEQQSCASLHVFSAGMRAFLETVLGIRIRFTCFWASRIQIHYSEVRIRIRILPFSHEGVGRTEIMLLK